MRSRSYFWSALPVACLIWCGTAVSLPAVTVGDLEKQLAGAQRTTVIDIRAPLLFARSHIVGAINVPASVCARKNLPPLGRVVVCDGGLGKEPTDAAVAALAAKPGITVEVLEGGFAAWESARAQTTQTKGVHRETHNYISYTELKALKADDVVLVDLRSAIRASAPQTAEAAASTGAPLTDLAEEFPGRPVSHALFAAPTSQAKAGAASITPPLLVLIDDGDGVAQAMARTLEANGTKRYVILTGGELALVRQGRAGRQRSSPASHLVPITPSAGPTAQK